MRFIFLLGLLLAFASSAFADPTAEPRPLPTTIGNFRQVKTNPPLSTEHDEGGTVERLAYQLSEYAGNKGDRVSVEIVRLRHEAQAYQELSLAAATARANNSRVEIVQNIGGGTAGFATADELVFFKGQHVVRIKSLKGNPGNINEVAQNLSTTLDKGEGDIPVLIKHLPQLEQTQKNAIFLNSFTDLSSSHLEQPVLNAVQGGGNADAALATYGPSKILLVEFNTPQLATENDKRIIARIQELWRLGQPAPSAYRRVGNYSVFVFDAPDEQTAKQLIDQVKYEQVVQWLGDNPNILREAEKRYVNTTLGVLVAVLKASGYAALLCVGVGGLIGGLLFTYRRSQQKAATAYSDAGGMLRLNLDELSAETNPSRLLRDRN
ncbi:MAG TPA: hypothetical protein VGN10_00855 [Pyrinomonadaceae bacterium]